MKSIQLNSDQYEHAHTRARQLRALLIMSFGEGGEVFRRMSRELQDDYLWLAGDLANEIENTLDRAIVNPSISSRSHRAKDSSQGEA
jgi:hypothetical protein